MPDTNDAKNDEKNDTPDGETLKKEIEELQETDADPETGRDLPPEKRTPPEARIRKDA